MYKNEKKKEKLYTWIIIEVYLISVNVLNKLGSPNFKTDLTLFNEL